MDQSTFTGMFLTATLALCGLLVWFGSAVWKLSSTLAKMEVTIAHVLQHSDGHEETLKRHTESINNHDTRIRVLEAVVHEE